MFKTYSNFNAGINKAGLQASAGTLESSKNVFVAGGNLEVMKGQTAIDPNVTDGAIFQSFPSAPGHTYTAVDRIGFNVLVKDRGVIGVLKGLWFLPLWSRLGGAENAHESMTGYGSDTFISPGVLPNSSSTAGVWPYDACIRWGGFASLGTMAYQSTAGSKDTWRLTSPATAGDAITGIKPGYLLYYGTASGTSTTWAGYKRVIDVETPVSAPIDIKVDAIGTTTYDRYCVVNVDPVGLPAPTLSPSRSLAAGGSLAAGVYRYCYRYVSSTLGIASNPSPVSGDVTVTGGSGNYTINVTTRYTSSDVVPYWADTIELFRAETTDDILYLVSSTSMVQTAGGYDTWTPEQTITDNGLTYKTSVISDTTDVTTLLSADYWNDRPSTMFGCRVYNNRLFGIKGSAQNTIKFSTINSMDKFPASVANVTSTDTDLQWLGGEIATGDAQPILVLAPEGGSFSATGQVGNSLLAFKRTRTYRLYGYDWDDFRLNDAFLFGTRDGRSVKNCAGIVCFMSQDHAMFCETGSMQPVPFTRNLWPNGYQTIASNDWFWGGFWSHLYLLSLPDSATSGIAYAFDIKNGFAATSMDYARYWAEYQNSTTSQKLIAASEGSLFYLLDKTDGTTFSVKSNPDNLSGDPTELIRQKNVKAVWLFCKNATGNSQTLTVKLFKNGYGTAGKTFTFTIPYSATSPYQIVLGAPSVTDNDPFNCYLYQWSIEGTTIPAGLTVEWVNVQYELLAAKLSN